MYHFCSITELAEALGEHRKNVERYAKTFREKGASYFFSRKETRGQCYKLREETRTEIQRRLKEGYSVYRIAKDYNISEASIRYHIKKGTIIIKTRNSNRQASH
jgi:DNA-binding NarL/FixJ family response regulator